MESAFLNGIESDGRRTGANHARNRPIRHEHANSRFYATIHPHPPLRKRLAIRERRHTLHARRFMLRAC